MLIKKVDAHYLRKGSNIKDISEFVCKKRYMIWTGIWAGGVSTREVICRKPHAIIYYGWFDFETKKIYFNSSLERDLWIANTYPKVNLDRSISNKQLMFVFLLICGMIIWQIIKDNL